MARTELEAATVHLHFAAHSNPHMGRTPDSLLHSLYICTDIVGRAAIRAALDAHYGCRVTFAQSERGAL